MRRSHVSRPWSALGALEGIRKTWRAITKASFLARPICPKSPENKRNEKEPCEEALECPRVLGGP